MGVPKITCSKEQPISKEWMNGKSSYSEKMTAGRGDCSEKGSSSKKISTSEEIAALEI